MSKPITAQCPYCHARYSVTLGQLRIADGHVRCGQCLKVFDVIPTLSDTAVELSIPKAQAQKAKKVRPIEFIQPSLMRQIRSLKVEHPELPVFSEKPASQSWAIIGCIIALMLIAGQYLWFERALLSKDPTLRPIYTLACQHINCTLSSASGLSSLNTTHLVVREIPDQPYALELLTGIHNIHNLPIQLPSLRLQFTDSNGRVIAASSFNPTVYRPQYEVIQPNERLDVQLFIKRPDIDHLGYEIEWIAVSSQ